MITSFSESLLVSIWLDIHHDMTAAYCPCSIVCLNVPRDYQSPFLVARRRSFPKSELGNTIA